METTLLPAAMAGTTSGTTTERPALVRIPLAHRQFKGMPSALSNAELCLVLKALQRLQECRRPLVDGKRFPAPLEPSDADLEVSALLSKFLLEAIDRSLICDADDQLRRKWASRRAERRLNQITPTMPIIPTIHSRKL